MPECQALLLSRPREGIRCETLFSYPACFLWAFFSHSCFFCCCCFAFCNSPGSLGHFFLRQVILRFDCSHTCADVQMLLYLFIHPFKVKQPSKLTALLKMLLKSVMKSHQEGMMGWKGNLGFFKIRHTSQSRFWMKRLALFWHFSAWEVQTNVSNLFFSSLKCAIDALKWPDTERCRELHSGKGNKQACHQSWGESLVQRYCQKAASISYIINIT